MTTKAKILIVISVVFVIAVGWLIWKWQNYGMVGGVTSPTDRTEYEEGGELKVNIENNYKKNICFSSCYPFFLEKKNGQWKSYLYGECKKPNINGTCIEPGQAKAFEINLSFVEEGLHRLVLPVCFNCKTGEEFKEIKRFYSNEFTIKEKKVDETADWKTYRSEEYGFEIKYPDNVGFKEWSLGIEGSAGIKFTPKEDDKYIDPPHPALLLFLKTKKISEQKSLKGLIKEHFELKELELTQWTKDMGIDLIEEETIGEDIQGYLIHGWTQAVGSCYYFIKHEHLFIEIQRGETGLNYLSCNNDALFNQMLSTFRFLD